MKRRKWSVEQGRRIIGEWRSSGLSMAAFASRRGINTERVRYWRDRVEGESDSPAAVTRPGGVRLAPAVIIGESAASAVSIRLPRGVVVETSDAERVSPRWVRELVDALEGAR